MDCKKPHNINGIIGISLLPLELQPAQVNKEMLSVSTSLNNYLDGYDFSIIEGSDILSLWPTAKIDRMNKKEAIGFLQIAERDGFGIEPDVRFGNVSISEKSKVILFRLPEKSPRAFSPEYKEAVILLRLTAAIKNPLTSVSVSEENYLQKCLNTSFNLSYGEGVRLRALGHWLMIAQPGLKDLKRLIAPLNLHLRKKLAEFAVGVACTGGNINSHKIRVVESIYTLLGMNPDDVYWDMHAMPVEGFLPATEPVTVKKAKTGLRGFAVPPRSITPLNAEFKLNQSKIAVTMEESVAVSNLLSQIFVEEEPSVLDKVITSTEASASMANLDNAHSALLNSLAQKSVCTRAEFEQLAAGQGLLPDAAIETINEAAFDTWDEPILEGDDPMEINQELIGSIFT